MFFFFFMTSLTTFKGRLQWDQSSACIICVQCVQFLLTLGTSDIQIPQILLLTQKSHPALILPSWFVIVLQKRWGAILKYVIAFSGYIYIFWPTFAKNITFANLMCMSATHRKCVLNHSAKGTQIEHKHLLYCCIFYHQLSILKFTNFLSTTSPCLFKRTNSTGQSSKGNLKRRHKSQTSPAGDSSALESPGLSESNRRRKSTVGKGWLP